MAAGVVDALEVVHVDQHHRQGALVGVGEADLAAEDRGQEAAVQRPRQGITPVLHIAQDLEHLVQQIGDLLDRRLQGLQGLGAVAAAVGLKPGQQLAVDPRHGLVQRRQMRRGFEQEARTVADPQAEGRVGHGLAAVAGAVAQDAEQGLLAPFHQAGALALALQIDVLIQREQAIGLVQPRPVHRPLHIGLAHQTDGRVDALVDQAELAEAVGLALQQVGEAGLQDRGPGHDQVHRNLDAGVDLADLDLTGDEGGVVRILGRVQQVQKPVVQRPAQPLLNDGVMQKGLGLRVVQQRVIKRLDQAVGVRVQQRPNRRRRRALVPLAAETGGECCWVRGWHRHDSRDIDWGPAERPDPRDPIRPRP
ncbi:hypothetical protein D3C87_1269330 [compost metagenome]